MALSHRSAKSTALCDTAQKISWEENVMIKTIAKPADKKVTGCGECRSTCQSACKTSCTVGNQSCERITREEKIERK